MEKITKKSAIQYCIDNMEDMPIEIKEVLVKMTETLSRTKSDKPTKTQLANISLTETIYNSMVAGNNYTISDIMKFNDELAVLSNQKISSLMKSLVDNGSVVRTRDRKNGTSYALKEVE